jgi:hypothetical protein
MALSIDTTQPFLMSVLLMSPIAPGIGLLYSLASIRFSPDLHSRAGRRIAADCASLRE